MTLTNKQLQDICLIDHIDKKKTCRYLAEDELQENKWYCCKLCPEIKKLIDIEVKTNKNVASGDNCQGYLFLRNINQGYDLE